MPDDYVKPPGAKNDYVDPPKELEKDYVAPPQQAENGNEFVEEYSQRQTSSNQSAVVENRLFKSEGNIKVKVLNSLKNLFTSLDKAWLFRQYVITILFAIFFTYIQSSDNLSLPYVILCTLLNPFARFLWLSIMDFFFGGTGLFYTTTLSRMVLIKVLTYAIIWIFSPILAPIGLIYLYFRVNRLNR